MTSRNATAGNHAVVPTLFVPTNNDVDGRHSDRINLSGCRYIQIKSTWRHLHVTTNMFGVCLPGKGWLVVLPTHAHCPWTLSCAVFSPLRPTGPRPANVASSLGDCVQTQANAPLSQEDAPRTPNVVNTQYFASLKCQGFSKMS